MTVLTPEQLAAPGTEHAHQTAFFASLNSPHLYINASVDRSWWPHFQFIYAIPSGGARDVVTAGRLKVEGVRSGVPDTHFPVARGPFNTLYMEFKKIERQGSKFGGLSDSQVKYKTWLESQGHCVAIVYGYRHALTVLEWYVQLK